jgi:dedicator of cytokinesis protein 1
MKNDEIRKLGEQYKDSTANASPFTMVLSGTIDAAVSGGMENYKKAFLSAEYLSKNPNQAANVKLLRDGFTEQLHVLSDAIVVHAAICPESMRKLQEHLEEKLEELKVST